MIDVQVIVGLPGSGKTHLAHRLADATTTVIDDLDRDFSQVAAFKASPTPRLIITDPKLCMTTPSQARRRIEEWFGDTRITFLSFENDPLACWANVERRADGRVISRATLLTMSRHYEINGWSRSIPVFRPESS